MGWIKSGFVLTVFVHCIGYRATVDRVCSLYRI